MTVITRAAAKPATAGGPQGRSNGRDKAVDLARAWCLTVVVVLHALMVGVTVGVDGPVLENALESWPGLAPFTWLVQIMPLFFVLGGFSAFTQWSRLSARGMSASGYVGIRMRRLLGPSVVAIAAIVVTLAALSMFGMPSDLVAVAGFRLSQPLWFLGVYAGATALVPAMISAHRRAPIRILAVLVALAAGVEVVRAATGLTAIGYLNLAFVWLLVQQLGFWLADDRLPRQRAVVGAIAVAAYGLLAVFCATGVFSFDLLADLNPPSCALVLLGVGQLALFELCRPALRRMHGLRWVGVVATAINLRAMTIYLWHMLVLVLAAGALLLVGARLPYPLSSEWWASRPLWLACVVAAVMLVALGAGRWEIARAGSKEAGETGRVAASVSPVLAMAGVVVLLVTGFSIAGGVMGLTLFASALALASGTEQRISIRVSGVGVSRSTGNGRWARIGSAPTQTQVSSGPMER